VSHACPVGVTNLWQPRPPLGRVRSSRTSLDHGDTPSGPVRRHIQEARQWMPANGSWFPTSWSKVGIGEHENVIVGRATILLSSAGTKASMTLPASIAGRGTGLSMLSISGS
jgi:hypothetical protein